MSKMKTVKSGAPSKIKKMTISRVAQGYHHDLDPYTIHPDKASAVADRSRLAKIGVGIKSRKPRASTFYTFMQDKRKNNPTKFGTVPQGPHVFPHFAIHMGLSKAKKQGKLDFFSKLIPNPVEFGKRVDSEIPSNHHKKARANVTKTIFKKKYNRHMTLREKGALRSEAETIKYAHSVNELLQMDPHGSYAYKGTGAGKAALSGKGESSKKPVGGQIDLPKNSGLTNIAAVQKRNATISSVLNKL